MGDGDINIIARLQNFALRLGGDSGLKIVLRNIVTAFFGAFFIYLKCKADDIHKST